MTAPRITSARQPVRETRTPFPGHPRESLLSRFAGARLYRWLLPLSTAGLVMSGVIKESSAFSVLPFDLTLALAAVIVMGVLVTAIREGVPRQVHAVVAAFALLIPPALFAGETAYATDKVGRLFTLTLLCILAPIVLIRSREDAERHLWAWALVSGIVVAGGVLNPVRTGDYAGAPLTTEGADTIDLGLASGVVLLVMMVALLWKRVPWLLALPAGGVAIFVLLDTGSRGPLISVVLGIATAALLVRTRPSFVRSGIVIALGAVGLVTAFAAAPYYAQLRIQRLILEGRVEGTASARVELFDAAWRSVTEHPFGIGLGRFDQVASLGEPYPHDLPLEVLAEAGVVLGLLFLTWIATELWRARATATDFASGAALALAVHTLVTALVSGDLNGNRTFFYALGIAIALRGLRASDPGIRSGQTSVGKSRGEETL